MNIFENLFSFLLNSDRLQSLDDLDLWKCCTSLAKTFCHDVSSDVIYELQVLQVTLLDGLMTSLEILQYIIVC
jgi:hypothetical protein